MAHWASRSIAGVAVAALAGIIIPHTGVNLKAVAAVPNGHAALLTQRAAAAQVPSNTLADNWIKLSRYPGLVHSTVSAEAYDITTHQVIAQVHPNLRVTPGSVTKLFTSAAALSTLGPDFTYKTTVMVPSSVASGQPGPVYLVGGGDPWLEANGAHDLEDLAKQVAVQIPQATQVIGVSPQFSSPTYGIGWPIAGIPQNYSAGASSLMAERSEVAVWVQGAGLVGRSPQVTFKFNGTAQDPGYFDVVNRATTSGSGTMASIRVTRMLGTNRIVVTGHVPQYSKTGPWVVSVDNPALYAAALFESALEKAGTSVSGPAAVENSLPTGLTTLATHTSPPLTKELDIQNQYSINQMADNLYRELSVSSTDTGSLSASASAMASFAQAAGIDPSRIQVDGSGLSPLNQMSAQDAINLLSYSAAQPWFTTFRNSMIHIDQAKSCGFLCPPSWTVPLPAHTAIWVKPGNLSNQWNLAGYVKAENGDLIAFAILNDGTPTSENTFPNSAVGQMMNEIADWPRVNWIRPTAAPASVSGVLPRQIRPLVEGIPLTDDGSSTAVAVVNVANGQTVFEQNGSTLTRAGLSPRILLDMAALKNLPNRLSDARVYQTGSATNGTLNGALILDGNNNDLNKNQLEALAKSVKAQGISTVTGGLEYVNPDGGFHSGRWPGGLAWEALGKGWAPPASSLYANFGQAAVTINGTTVGSPASIAVTPSDAPITVQNDTTVQAAGTAPHLTENLDFDSNTFVISGTVPAGYQATQTIAPPNPGLLAAQRFEDDLTADGVNVTGAPHGISAVPGTAAQVGQTLGNSVALLVRQSLHRISLVPSNQLASALGPKASKEVKMFLGGQPSSLSDYTGGSLGSYLTPLSLADALAHQYRNRSEMPLVRSLNRSIWKVEAPEQYEALGYVHGPDHATYAVVVMATGLKWNGQFAPHIVHP